MVHASTDETAGVVRIGMVGGGPGAFIGAVHRICLRMDGKFALVAGCFSSDAERSRQAGRELGLDPARVYATYEEMAEKEAALPAGERIQAVSIVTPNNVHFGPAKLFLEKGVHVICDKPLTITVEQAEELAALVEKTGLVFCVTHNYTGYPMVREARELVCSGRLGEIRKVYVEYLQGWLADRLEATGQKQAAWRTDPERSGPCGAMGDIGTHAENLVEYVTGRPMARLYARLHTYVEGRPLDDDGMVLFELEGGGSGTLTASQVCAGRENGLRLRVFGTEGGLEWDPEHPNDLVVYWKDRAPERRRPGNAWAGEAAQDATRIPPGHPEGYLEAFANLYTAFARRITAAAGTSGLDRGDSAQAAGAREFPTIYDGLRGMRFLRAVLRSHRENAWVEP